VPGREKQQRVPQRNAALPEGRRQHATGTFPFRRVFWLAKLGDFRAGFGTAWDLAPDGKRAAFSELAVFDTRLYVRVRHIDEPA
jgi:hypothetical protein